jgi:hypothetical protein
MPRLVVYMTAVLVAAALAVSVGAETLLAAPSSRPDCRSLLEAGDVEAALGTEVRLRSVKNIAFYSAPGPGIRGEAAEGTRRACGSAFDNVPEATAAAATLIAGFGESPRQWNAYRRYRKSSPYGESFAPVSLGRKSKAFALKGREKGAPYALFVLTRHENVFALELIPAEGNPASPAALQAEKTLAKTIMIRLDKQWIEGHPE